MAHGCSVDDGLEGCLRCASKGVTHLELERFLVLGCFIAFAGAVVSLVLLAFIICWKHLWGSSLNKFVAGVCLSNFLTSSLCFTTYITRVSTDDWTWDYASCQFQSFYLSYGCCASMWMKVVLARELSLVAWAGFRSENYQAPTLPCRAVAGVHFLSLILASIHLIPGLPLQIGGQQGLVCLPMDYNQTSMGFLFGFIVPLEDVFPFVLILWYCKRTRDSFQRQSGALMFVYSVSMRMLAVCVGVWLPSRILTWVACGPVENFIGVLLINLEGVLCVAVYGRTPDISLKWTSFRRLLSSRFGTGVLKFRDDHLDDADLPTSPTSTTFSGAPSTFSQSVSIRSSNTEDIGGLLHEEFPMQVIEYDAWLKAGHLPRHSEGRTRLPLEEDVCVFISHRWWSLGCPDDSQGSKYANICKGLAELIYQRGLRKKDVVIWCDWTCIEQDDMGVQAAGIQSLVSYAARSAYMLIPVASDPVSIMGFKAATHPMMLHNYGERAWCRLEVYMFMCAAELQRRVPHCYGYGLIDLPRCYRWQRQRLRPLYSKTRGGAFFDLSYLPSSGALTVESDRAMIKKVEDDLHRVYTRKAIMEQRLMLLGKPRLRKCMMRGKQIRSSDVPMLASEIFCDVLSKRIQELHLEGNLIDGDGAALLVQLIVCSPKTTSLSTLCLSRNMKLGIEGCRQLSFAFLSPHCILRALRLSDCKLTSAAVMPLAATIPYSRTMKEIDLSQNEIDDAGCIAMLEACGGTYSPVVAIDIDDNPITDAMSSKVANVRTFVELGRGSRRTTADTPVLSQRGTMESLTGGGHFLSSDVETSIVPIASRSSKGSGVFLGVDAGGSCSPRFREGVPGVSSSPVIGMSPVKRLQLQCQDPERKVSKGESEATGSVLESERKNSKTESEAPPQYAESEFSRGTLFDSLPGVVSSPEMIGNPLTPRSDRSCCSWAVSSVDNEAVGEGTPALPEFSRARSLLSTRSRAMSDMGSIAEGVGDE